MVLYLIHTKFAIDLSSFQNIFESNKVYVIKIKNRYFMGFVVKDGFKVNKKTIKLRKINIVDSLPVPFLESLIDNLKELSIQKDYSFKYFWLGIQKILKTVIHFDNTLKIYIKGVDISLNDIKKIKFYSIECDYMENYTCLTISIKDSADIKSVKQILRKKIRKKMTFSFDYVFYVNENYYTLLSILGLMNLKKDKENERICDIVYDLERIFRKKENFFNKENTLFWKDYKFDYTDQNFSKVVFPLWGLIFHKFFDKIEIDYFSGFRLLDKFFKKLSNKVVFKSFVNIYGIFKVDNSLVDNILKMLGKLKEKMIFENFSYKRLLEFLKHYEQDGLNILFYSFYKGFYRLYCSYCGNQPYCEICKSTLKVIYKSGKIKLFCNKCSIKYDISNCQFCNNFDFKLWQRNYKEDFSSFNTNFNTKFIDFLPSNFYHYVGNKEYFVIIDYFSLFKPFVIKELNIWYILLKFFEGVNIKNIVFVNIDDFDVYSYFYQFFMDDKLIIDRLSELVYMERRMGDILY